MEGIDRDFLQQELVNRPVGAVLFSGGRLQATDAAPDDGLAAVVIPVNTPIKLLPHLGMTALRMILFWKRCLRISVRRFMGTISLPT